MASVTQGNSAGLNPYRCHQKSGSAHEDKAKHRDEATSMGIEVIDCGVRVAEEINAAIAAFADHTSTGLVVLPDPIVLAH